MTADRPVTGAPAPDRAEKERWVSRVLGWRFDAQAPEGGDERAGMVASLLETLSADLDFLAGHGEQALTGARTLFASGQAAANAQDYAAALTALGACADEVARLKRAASTSEARQAVPEGFVQKAVRQLELSAALWETSRMRALDGLDELTETLRGEDDPELDEIAGRVDELTRAVPNALEAALGTLCEAVGAGDEQRVKAAKDDIAGQLQVAGAFLADNATALVNCEENPWGIDVALVQPLTEAMHQIEAAIGAI
jgi:hypothetical protein